MSKNKKKKEYDLDLIFNVILKTLWVIILIMTILICITIKDINSKLEEIIDGLEATTEMEVNYDGRWK